MAGHLSTFASRIIGGMALFPSPWQPFSASDAVWASQLASTLSYPGCVFGNLATLKVKTRYLLRRALDELKSDHIRGSKRRLKSWSVH